MNSSKFGAWRLEGYPQVIEYSLAVLEQMQAEVAAGFSQFPRGGMAVGGILYGQGDRHLVRILAVRPMPCEHSAGPSFTLSENDHADLAGVLAVAGEDAELQGLEPVGWFHSHTRGSLTMTPSDLEVHQRHFPEAWQVAMIVKPEEDGPTQVGVFVRQEDGAFPSQPVLTVDDLNSILATGSGHAPAPRAPSASSPEPAGEPSAPETPPAPTAPSDPKPSTEPEPPAEPADPPRGPVQEELFSSIAGPPAEPKSEPASEEEQPAGKWIGVAAGSAAAVALLLAAFHFLTPPEYWQAVRIYKDAATEYIGSTFDYWERKVVANAGEDLNLRAIGSGAKLLIRWDGVSRLMTGATGGVLEIDDGGTVEQIPLDMSLLVQGSYSRSRLSSDVRIGLTVHRESGVPVTEHTRFFGHAALAEDSATKELESSETLQAEIERLRSAIARQADQNVTLQGTLNTLRELRIAQELAAASTPAARQPAPVQAPPPVAAPPVFEQRPARISASASGQGGVALIPQPDYRGPRSGRILWTGVLQPGQPLVLGNSSASTGSMVGRWPGVAVNVTVAVAEITGQGLVVFSSNPRYQSNEVVEEPGAQNSWNRTTFRYAPDRAGDVTVIETPSNANGFKRLSARASGRAVTALLVSWTVTE